MITIEEARDRVAKFGHVFAHQDYVIDSVIEEASHWLVVYGVKSIENPDKIFMRGRLIVEKQSGDIYFAPSRSSPPINIAEFPMNRNQLVCVTAQDLAQSNKN